MTGWLPGWQRGGQGQKPWIASEILNMCDILPIHCNQLGNYNQPGLTDSVNIATNSQKIHSYLQDSPSGTPPLLQNFGGIMNSCNVLNQIYLFGLIMYTNIINIFHRKT